MGRRNTEGAFKTPSLRNVSRTAPSTLEGRFATLEDVVRFSSELPDEPPVGHREETLQPLHLSDAEIRDLVAFHEALDGTRVAEALRHAPDSVGSVP